MNFSKRLLKWYKKNGRSLPWRGIKDPYLVWLSEIILQQTRIQQGMPYYNKLSVAYPTIDKMAAASEQEILKLWQGLGYYSRARNMHHTAQYITKELKGVFPTTFEGLLGLKGVGNYTASAIASICFELPEPVVDGNVYRFFSRFFGIKSAIDENKSLEPFKKIGREMIKDVLPSDFNQAIMEFGALQCVPQPNCEICIFKSDCWARGNNWIDKLPVKSKKIKIKIRYFNYIVFLSKDKQTRLYKRNKKDIWYQLYEFPLIETSKKVPKNQLIKHKSFQKIVNDNSLEISRYNKKAILHKLTHQNIYIYFWIAKPPSLSKPYNLILKLKDYPVPVVIDKFIKNFYI